MDSGAPVYGSLAGLRLAALGSTNPAKLAAADAVLRRLAPDARLVATEVPSGVSAQPLGDEETLKGALGRAQNARRLAGADLGIGMEGGVAFTPHGAFVTSWCAVVDAAGRVGLGRGPAFSLPPGAAARVRAGEELGPVVDDLSGRREAKAMAGAIGFLTGGLVDRRQLWETALACALAPFIHPELYDQEQSERVRGTT